MYISAKLDYALRVLADLAGRPEGEAVAASALAGGHGFSVSYVRAILVPLDQHGIVERRHNPPRGYRLARPPTTISVADVVTAVRIRTVDVHPGPGDRDLVGLRLGTLWERLERTTVELLASITLADLVTPVSTLTVLPNYDGLGRV
jgi:Rrf2 family protein